MGRHETTNLLVGLGEITEVFWNELELSPTHQQQSKLLLEYDLLVTYD